MIEFPTGERQERSEGYLEVTAPRMELMAATVALENLSHCRSGTKITLTTDCTYVQKGITEWISGWRRRNWRTTNGGDVKHKDLWMRLDKAKEGMDVEFKWVKGHTGHELNEIADTLAQKAAENAKYGNNR